MLSTDNNKVRLDDAQLINQTSGAVEWYTPERIVEAARRVMGGIDLDPASCERANATVGAEKIYTVSDDGLRQDWYGCVWLNHPFGKITNKPWINKLISEYQSGNVQQAVCICFAATSEKWFQPLLLYPICFVSPRVNYVGPDGLPVRGVTKGSCVAYMGANVEAFTRVFSGLGRVMIPATQD